MRIKHVPLKILREGHNFRNAAHDKIVLFRKWSKMKQNSCKMSRVAFSSYILCLAVAAPVTARLSATATFIKTPISSSSNEGQSLSVTSTTTVNQESYSAKLAEDHSTGADVTHQLASYGLLLDLQCYVERQPSFVYSRDVDGWTLLHEASAGGHITTVDYLLSKGADLNAETYMGATALSLAEERLGSDSPIVQYLISQGGIRNNNASATLRRLRGETVASIEELLVKRHRLKINEGIQVGN